MNKTMDLIIGWEIKHAINCNIDTCFIGGAIKK